MTWARHHKVRCRPAGDVPPGNCTPADRSSGRRGSRGRRPGSLAVRTSSARTCRCASVRIRQPSSQSVRWLLDNWRWMTPTGRTHLQSRLQGPPYLQALQENRSKVSTWIKQDTYLLTYCCHEKIHTKTKPSIGKINGHFSYYRCYYFYPKMFHDFDPPPRNFFRRPKCNGTSQYRCYKVGLLKTGDCFEKESHCIHVHH